MERLLLPEPPFFHWVKGDADLLDDSLATLRCHDGLVVRHLRGSKMLTNGDLFDEFAAVLQFPHYFGENWDAFDECLNDLEWLPANGYLIVIFDADRVLEKEPPSESQVFIEILQSVAENLAEPQSVQGMPHRPGVPFHVLLLTQHSPSRTHLHRVLKTGKLAADEFLLTT